MPLYFAYGSNLLSRRLRQCDRAPAARRFAVGALDGFELRFHKRGRDGSGKCDVWRTAQAADRVWGVLWEVADEELAILDRAEGEGYRRLSVRVSTPTSELEAHTYVARPRHVDRDLLPFSWYRELVLAGAREHSLPASWIAFLEAHETVVDADRRRDARFRRLLVSELA